MWSHPPNKISQHHNDTTHETQNIIFDRLDEMKKLLGILVLGLLVCNFAEASWVIWDFEKGYVYIVLKNTENIENEIKNNSTNTERINKLGCTEGIKKTKLKKRPPGYEMV